MIHGESDAMVPGESDAMIHGRLDAMSHHEPRPVGRHGSRRVGRHGPPRRTTGLGLGQRNATRPGWRCQNPPRRLPRCSRSGREAPTRGSGRNVTHNIPPCVHRVARSCPPRRMAFGRASTTRPDRTSVERTAMVARRALVGLAGDRGCSPPGSQEQGDPLGSRRRTSRRPSPHHRPRPDRAHRSNATRLWGAGSRSRRPRSRPRPNRPKPTAHRLPVDEAALPMQSPDRRDECAPGANPA